MPINPNSQRHYGQRSTTTTQPATQPSKRVRECLALLAQGMKNHEIAEHLGISKRTAEDYVYKAKLKLNCKTRRELSALSDTYVIVRSDDHEESSSCSSRSGSSSIQERRTESPTSPAGAIKV